MSKRVISGVVKVGFNQMATQICSVLKFQTRTPEVRGKGHMGAGLIGTLIKNHGTCELFKSATL